MRASMLQGRGAMASGATSGALYLFLLMTLWKVPTAVRSGPFLVMSSLYYEGRRAPSWNRLRHQLGKERKWPRTIVIGGPSRGRRFARLLAAYAALVGHRRHGGVRGQRTAHARVRLDNVRSEL